MSSTERSKAPSKPAPAPAIPDCSPELFERLACDDPEQIVRAGAARSALCPQALLEKMVTDPDARVRGAVVRTGRLGEADLSWLGADRDDHVRIGVALANGCPAALLDAVIRDRSVQVRKMVASRDDLGEGALLEGRGAN